MIKFYTREEGRYSNYFYLIPDNLIKERTEDYVLFIGEGRRFYHENCKFYSCGNASSAGVKYYPIENKEDNEKLKQILIKHGCWPYDWVLRNYPRGE